MEKEFDRKPRQISAAPLFHSDTQGKTTPLAEERRLSPLFASIYTCFPSHQLTPQLLPARRATAKPFPNSLPWRKMKTEPFACFSWDVQRIQGDHLAQRLYLVDFVLVVLMNARFCLGSSKPGRIGTKSDINGGMNVKKE